MKENVARPNRLIDITGLPLAETEETCGLRIDALVRNSNLAYDERVKSHYPLLACAILAGGTVALIGNLQAK
jgi:xanthine dehydrogenase YagS FAD-binding subunit